jgi:hypothetical protein
MRTETHWNRLARTYPELDAEIINALAQENWRMYGPRYRDENRRAAFRMITIRALDATDLALVKLALDSLVLQMTGEPGVRPRYSECAAYIAALP